MKAKPTRSLAITASHNRICFVFFIGEQPMDWELSYVGASSVDQASKKVSQWIRYYQAEYVIAENLKTVTRKGERTLHLIDAIHQTSIASSARLVTVHRTQPFQSKYEQIDELSKQYPQMKILAPPKRKYWENERHTVSYFEALALAVTYFECLSRKKPQPPSDLPT